MNIELTLDEELLLRIAKMEAENAASSIIKTAFSHPTWGRENQRYNEISNMTKSIMEALLGSEEFKQDLVQHVKDEWKRLATKKVENAIDRTSVAKLKGEV